MLRVYIDEAGLPRTRAGRAQLGPRAARRGRRSPRCSKARFKPYTENGQPVAGWAFVPLDFELEKMTVNTQIAADPGFAHFIGQSDAVGKTLLAILS